MRYNKTIRMILLWVSEFIFETQILDYLYPDECMISFGDFDLLDGKVKGDENGG